MIERLPRRLSGRSSKCLSLLAMGWVCLCCGCALERSGVSADSNSRLPFFNFQFAPAKKDSANYHRSVQLEQRPAELVQPAKAPVQREVRLASWIPGLGQREALPLPLAELPAEPASEHVPLDELRFE